MLWDLFCRVIDNHGDAGVCWRLARALAARGEQVRLWIDQPAMLAWMAPQGAAGVALIDWNAALPDLAPGAVVIEAFGCDLPAGFVARMAAARPTPVWINLEYLSAEPYVARSHGLPSPQFSGPGTGLTKWFFYPGFSVATGGLLADEQPPSRADSRRWLGQNGWAPAADEQVALLFCYANPALPALLQALGPLPRLLLLPPGPAQAQIAGMTLPPGQRCIKLPYLAQPDFDRLLAATDFNLVRGEDSFVQAQVSAAAPFLWHIYPQQDGAHAAKLEAFLDGYLDDAPAALAAALRGSFRAINGLAAMPQTLPEPVSWRAWHLAWRAKLRACEPLDKQLLRFVKARLP